MGHQNRRCTGREQLKCANFMGDQLLAGRWGWQRCAECFFHLRLAARLSDSGNFQFLRPLMKTLFAAIMFIFLLGCDSPESGRETLESKSEYSILQHYEYLNRDHSNKDGVQIFASAIGSDYDVIGLPALGSAKGFVWVITNPADHQEVRKIPDGLEFHISAEELAKISEEVRLNPATEHFLKTGMVNALGQRVYKGGSARTVMHFAYAPDENNHDDNGVRGQ